MNIWNRTIVGVLGGAVLAISSAALPAFADYYNYPSFGYYGGCNRMQACSMYQQWAYDMTTLPQSNSPYLNYNYGYNPYSYNNYNNYNNNYYPYSYNYYPYNSSYYNYYPNYQYSYQQPHSYQYQYQYQYQYSY